MDEGDTANGAPAAPPVDGASLLRALAVDVNDASGGTGVGTGAGAGGSPGLPDATPDPVTVAEAGGDGGPPPPPGPTGTGPGGGASPTPPAAPDVPPLRLDDLVLLAPGRAEPVAVRTMVIDGTGVSVESVDDGDHRHLPWSDVSSYAVEPWAGGFVPEWWVDPELDDRDGPDEPSHRVTDPAATARTRPTDGPGVVLSVMSGDRIYRFLRAGTDPGTLAARIAASAASAGGQGGPVVRTTVTTASPSGTGRPDGTGPAGGPGTAGPWTWSRIRPVAAVLLGLAVIGIVTLILLQSAGVIHVPLLGGGSGVVGAVWRPLGAVGASGPFGAVGAVGGR